MSEHLTGFDSWKTAAPDPGSGPSMHTPAQAFWRAYAIAQRHGLVQEFLDAHRGVARFADLVRQAEAQQMDAA